MILRAYRLPKVQKDGCPLRPIVSFVGSPTYNLSEFLREIFKPLAEANTFTVRNCKEFVTMIRQQQLGDQDVMVSFDAVSLFSNVPVNLATDIIEKHLPDDCILASGTSLTVDDIMILLGFCLNQTYITFAGTAYHQIEGVPMGSAVLVIISDLSMNTWKQHFCRPPPSLPKCTAAM